MPIFLKKIKKVLRKNKTIIKIYYYFKRAILFPLKFTSLKPLAKVTFPLKELLKPSKLSLLKKIAPFSLGSYGVFDNVYNLANDVEKKGINGAYVECGTWKGGCAAIMAVIANRYQSNRITWYFDSFEGMPEPTEKDERGKGKKGTMKDIMGDVLKVSVLDVEKLVFNILHLPREKNIIVKGWFKDTLPEKKNQIGPIAILRLDGDWYESTMIALKELYDQVVPGGYVIIDDYGSWEGCRRAVHEFADEHKIVLNLQYIGTHDLSAFTITPPAYFKKVN